MTKIVPTGTKCDANCTAWAHTRITILTVMLPVYLCRHHEHEFTKAMQKKPALAYEAEYNPVTV
ncbi:hypothetical protein [Zhihengliuella flava]|uniref:Uncharacterized protein n=1 Tax=Zhihengliuella flava TaxID=1285193 RepID=A0A931D8Y6_9MICC|nr:hypothetical protein [Zhihengliuella flava]MBG6085825.1 hypothetical protein [Zhihengliuella flava]